jgi:hypothetical protein
MMERKVVGYDISIHESDWRGFGSCTGEFATTLAQAIAIAEKEAKHLKATRDTKREHGGVVFWAVKGIEPRRRRVFGIPSRGSFAWIRASEIYDVLLDGKVIVSGVHR